VRRLLLWLFLAGIAPALAGLHKIPEEHPIAAISIPDKWQTKELGEGVEAVSPDGALHLIAIPPERNKTSEAMGEVMRYIRNTRGIVVRPESIKNEPGKLKEMDIRNVSWQGKDKNGDISIRFTVVWLAQAKQLLVACWGPPKAERKYESTLKQVLQSIKQS